MARRRSVEVVKPERAGFFPDVLDEVFAEMEEKWRREAEERDQRGETA